MECSAADEVLIHYCLKNLSREWRYDCQYVNWNVQRLVQENALKKNKEFLNENDYDRLLRIEELIREECDKEI